MLENRIFSRARPEFHHSVIFDFFRKLLSEFIAPGRASPSLGTLRFKTQ